MIGSKESEQVTSGGHVTRIQMEHVWVSACVRMGVQPWRQAGQNRRIRSVTRLRPRGLTI